MAALDGSLSQEYKNKISIGIFIFLVSFLMSIGIHAQDAGSDDGIRLETTLIQVPVIVKGAGGRYITDLDMGEFSIFENGVKQEIALIKSIEEAFNVILLIDSSGSTVGQLNQIKAGAKQFINHIRDHDKVMVISFNDSVSTLSPFTSDVPTLYQAIDSIQPGEFTQVYEAVYMGIWERLERIEGRKAVILFTDGIDTASSEINREDTLDAVLESEDVIVYPIRYNTRPNVERKLKVNAEGGQGPVGERSVRVRKELDSLYGEADDYLDELAELTGGKVERVDQLTDLGPALTKIAEELRNQYLIAYYPIRTKVPKRVLEVRISRPGCQVRVRPGFKVRIQ